MPLTSIDPTPNPNAMKLNFDREISFTGTANAENKEHLPRLLQDLLEIDGVDSLFVMTRFLTITKRPDSDWEAILAKAREVFEFSPQG